MGDLICASTGRVWEPCPRQTTNDKGEKTEIFSPSFLPGENLRGAAAAQGDDRDRQDASTDQREATGFRNHRRGERG